ncbi:MAG: response regulator transcription factor [Caldilineaceae bacterium]|nr:response regulator transcription factor [Caldilineaceae bacterium]
MTQLDHAIEPKSEQSSKHILVVEDDEALRKLLLLTLTLDGYQVITANDGREALTLFGAHTVDCVLLDINMPMINGLEVCSALRKWTDVPIIIITANTRSDDVITGMDVGADHYMTKPFVLQELRARISAILRRVRYQGKRNNSRMITYGEITLNEELQQVIVRGEIVNLTPNEYRMLSYLMHRPDKPVRKEEFLRAVWGYEPHGDLNFVRINMSRLRSKVEEDPATPRYLKTVRGLGYQFSTKPPMETNLPTGTSAPTCRFEAQTNLSHYVKKP